MESFWFVLLMLVTEKNTVLRVAFLSSGMELYQDIFLECFSLHSADIAQDTGGIGHTSVENKYRAKSLSFLGPKIWSKIGPIIKNLEHHLILCMLLRKIFYFICKANSIYYHIIIMDSIFWISHTSILSSFYYQYPFKSFVIF